MMWLKSLARWYNFTIYDHRNGEDGFAAAFDGAPNGRVVQQPNQCDETTGYLAPYRVPLGFWAPTNLGAFGK